MLKQQEEAVSDTTTSFRDLEKQIRKLSSELDSILKNVQNMERARSSTLEAVESISAISEETTACSITVSESAEKQLGAVTHLEQAATQLLSRARDLDKSINLFKINYGKNDNKKFNYYIKLIVKKHKKVAFKLLTYGHNCCKLQLVNRLK